MTLGVFYKFEKIQLLNVGYRMFFHDQARGEADSGALRHSVGVFQLIFGTQYFCLFGSLDESMLKILL